jgi:hypothetical protein
VLQTYDDVIAALAAGRGEPQHFQKSSVTTVAAQRFSLWPAGGMPAAGVFQTALTGARQLVNATGAPITGAIPFADPAAGNIKHLLSFGIGSSVAAGVFLLYDRLAEYPLNGTVTSGTFSSITIPARDANGAAAGAGCMMFCENAVATTLAAVNLTVNYLDQDGGAGTTGAQAIIAGAQYSIPHQTQGMFLPLAVGDTGVRRITDYVLSATALSASINLVICRPLAWLPMNLANGYAERDTIIQIASLPKLYAGTCLALNLAAATTSSGVVNGVVQHAEG